MFVNAATNYTPVQNNHMHMMIPHNITLVYTCFFLFYFFYISCKWSIDLNLSVPRFDVIVTLKE